MLKKPLKTELKLRNNSLLNKRSNVGLLACMTAYAIGRVIVVDIIGP